jgi:hypothetical protein
MSAVDEPVPELPAKRSSRALTIIRSLASAAASSFLAPVLSKSMVFVLASTAALYVHSLYLVLLGCVCFISPALTSLLYFSLFSASILAVNVIPRSRRLTAHILYLHWLRFPWLDFTRPDKRSCFGFFPALPRTRFVPALSPYSAHAVPTWVTAPQDRPVRVIGLASTANTAANASADARTGPGVAALPDEVTVTIPWAGGPGRALPPPEQLFADPLQRPVVVYLHGICSNRGEMHRSLLYNYLSALRAAAVGPTEPAAPAATAASTAAAKAEVGTTAATAGACVHGEAHACRNLHRHRTLSHEHAHANSATGWSSQHGHAHAHDEEAPAPAVHSSASTAARAALADAKATLRAGFWSLPARISGCFDIDGAAIPVEVRVFSHDFTCLVKIAGCLFHSICF